MDSPSTWGAPPAVAGETYSVMVKRTAKRFVDDFLQPGDLAAVVHTQGTFTDAQAFTSSKALLDASIDRYGRGLSGDLDVTPPEREQRHMDSYRAIQDVANRLGSITGRRKAILWVGAQLKYDLTISKTTRMSDILVAHREAIAAATRNNVAVYAIDPAGLQNVNVDVAGTSLQLGGERPGTFKNDLDRLASLRLVAEDTGGLAVVNTNNFAGGFTSIVRDNSTYYVLGYAPPVDYQDGKFHPVTVRVKRAGSYTVRQRKGYTAPTPPKQPLTATEAPAGASAASREALRLPVPVRGLNVSIFNAPFKGGDGAASVVIGGEVSGDLLLDNAQPISLSYQVFTQENHVQAGEYKTFTLSLEQNSRANVVANGLHFVERLSLPPGRYEIRYAVDQPGGHVGSVVAPLIIPKFDDALSLSGVVLASDRTATHFMLRDDAGIRERLGANPTSERAFHRGDLLNAYVEVYSDDARLTADDLTVTGILSTLDGKPVSRQDARLRSVVQSGDGRWAYTVEMDLADVPAGSYAVTLEAVSPRHKEPVRRVIPITVEE
jgi:VWFA-related protein